MPTTTRLSSALLLQTNRFLLRLYASADLGHLRSVIPHGLGQLIVANRVSVNFISRIVTGQTKVVPVNVPPYWARLGEVYCKYVHEHVLYGTGTSLHCVRGFSDPRADLDWEKSALYNEYYRPIGCHHHIGVNVSRAGGDLVNVGFNRETRDFRPEDRVLLQLLSCHLGNALHRARQLDPSASTDCYALPNFSPRRAVIEFDRSTGRLTRISSVGAALILQYVGAEIGEDRPLPDQLRRWFEVQRKTLADPDSLALPVALTLHQDDRRLTISLGRVGTETETLLMQETLGARALGTGTQARLTRREQEVLDWLAEGKGNREIAGIIGVSVRTIEKHVERTFAKLGTVTRTAAMARAIEIKLRRQP